MKKKTNVKSKVSDIIVILICLLGMTTSFILFWLDLNETLSKQNEKPIGTITFKYKTAQRRFDNRVLWDRLKQNSVVYNGDTIHTAPLSDATITFFTKNPDEKPVKIEMYENSMIQIFGTSDGEYSASLSGGQASVDAGTQGSVTVFSGKNRIEITNDSEVLLSILENADENDLNTGVFRLSVRRGKAKLGNDGNEEEYSEGDVTSVNPDGSVFEDPYIAVVAPQPVARILNSSEGSAQIQFLWKTKNFSPDTKIRIQIAADKSFSNILQSTDTQNKNQILMDVPNGTFFWRLYPVIGSEDFSAQAITGKLIILQATVPKPIAPIMDYQYSYRLKKPTVRFLWTGNEQATAYYLEIADNKALKNPIISKRTTMLSSIISDLDKGKWYWAVTPIYSIGSEIQGEKSVVSSFIINQNEMLRAPSLVSPLNNAFVNVVKEDEKIVFSWKNNPDAQSYTISIAKDRYLQNPIIKETVANNYYSYNAASKKLNQEQLFWGVYQTDTEGNNSEISDVRTFTGIDGSIIYRTIFPPDNYVAADAFLPDISFMWKSNLPYSNKLQFSRSSTFNDKVIEQVLTSKSHDGIILTPGDYYWRLDAATGDGGASISTPARHLKVVPPFERVAVTEPVDNKRVVIKQGEPVNFLWQPIKNAHYYQFKLYKKEGNSKIFIYENLFLEQNALSMMLDAYGEGEYFWTVQAFANETEFSTRRSGLIMEADFELKHLFPVILNTPRSGIVYDGLKALREPINFTWSETGDKTATSKLIVSTNPNPLASTKNQTVASFSNPPKTVSVKRLASGTYYWTVEAYTYDGLNISAERSEKFTVTPVPLLPKAATILPEDESVIGFEQIKKTRELVFSWDPVPDATDYIFTIYRVVEKEKIFDEEDSAIALEKVFDKQQKDITYTISDLAVLDKGKFVWTVEALGVASDGFVEQHGEIKRTYFTIDLPAINNVHTVDPGVLYGN